MKLLGRAERHDDACSARLCIVLRRGYGFTFSAEAKARTLRREPVSRTVLGCAALCVCVLVHLRKVRTSRVPFGRPSQTYLKYAFRVIQYFYIYGPQEIARVSNYQTTRKGSMRAAYKD